MSGVTPGAAVIMDGVSMRSVGDTINALLEDFDRKQNLIQQLLNDSSKERYAILPCLVVNTEQQFCVCVSYILVNN